MRLEIAGIVITASHNPREYNGYKVYWEDGAQITPPHDKNILAEVAKVTSFDLVKTMDEVKAREAGLYQEIDQEIDDAYMAELKKQSIRRLFLRWRKTLPSFIPLCMEPEISRSAVY